MGSIESETIGRVTLTQDGSTVTATVTTLDGTVHEARTFANPYTAVRWARSWGIDTEITSASDDLMNLLAIDQRFDNAPVATDQTAEILDRMAASARAILADESLGHGSHVRRGVRRSMCMTCRRFDVLQVLVDAAQRDAVLLNRERRA